MAELNTAHIETLESRIAFLDQELSELRDSVDAHQRQILALEQLCATLTQRLRDVLDTVGDGDGATEAGGHEVPPHY